MSVTLLLETLVGGAMMHALTRDKPAGDTARHARRPADFLLHAVTATSEVDA